IDVNIIDDLPTAVGDSNVETATEQHTTLTGNVLGNDTQGADRVPSGPITAGTFVGTYGTLVLSANGSYTYTLNTSDPDFFNLHGGGSGIEQFTYTLTDADGDVRTAVLELNVTNLNDPVTLTGLGVQGGELTVYEKHLADGSSPDAGELTQTGSFTVTALDGLQTLTVGGITVVSGGVVAGFPQSVLTGLGNTLTITGYNPSTGVVSYSYTLTDNEAHPNANEANSLSESFTVTATDTDGSTASGDIDVNIIDDLPTAVGDSNVETATEQHTTLTGNVLGNDTQGADRVPSGPITAGTFVGTYGTLVLSANGSYTYTLNASDPDFFNLHGGGSGIEQFTYTLTDADGDVRTAVLELNVTNLNDPVTLTGLGVQGGELTVYEKNLADGSAPDTPALTQTGSFTVTALDGLQTLTVGGITVISGGVVAGFPQSVLTGLGNTLTITGYNASTGVVSYSYTLTDNEAHPNGNEANSLSESFTVTATDTDGSTATGNIDVNIIDDLPTAVGDSNVETATEQHTTLTGNVLGNDTQGADRVPSGPITAGTFVGTYGTLVLSANGAYTYTLNTSDPDFFNLHGGGSGIEQFTYTLTDADGDVRTAVLELNVTNLDNPVTFTGLDITDGELIVYEKHLADGTSPDAGELTQSGSFTVTALDGLQTLTVGGITVVSGGVVAGFPQSATTDLGNTLTITGYNPSTGVVNYSYNLADNATHPDANGTNNLSESLAVSATDTDGSIANGSIDITIVDDVPSAVDAERAVSPGQVDSNLLLVIDVSGSMNFASGVPGLTRLQLAKQAISALLDKYDEMGDIKVQIVTFSDGATQESSVWVSLTQAKNIVNGLSAGGATYYDSAVNVAKNAFVASGKLAGAQNISYFFSDGEPTSGHSITADREASWETFLDDNGIKSYAIGLGSGVNESNLNPLAYDGSTHTDTNAVVVTDLSQLSNVLSGTVLGAPITGSLLSGGELGADGGFIKTLVVDGTTYTYDPKANGGDGSYAASGGADHGTFDTATNTFNIKTNLGGTLLVDMDTGDFIYTPPKDTGVTQQESFGFTVSDNDGDLASATLTVNIYTNTAPVAGADHIITNITGASITVPAEVLLANDSDADHDKLTASPITFDTDFSVKGEGFSVGNGTPVVDFNGTGGNDKNRFKELPRSAFRGTANSMVAALIVDAFVRKVGDDNGHDQDVMTVHLKKGETLTLDHNVPTGNLEMLWKDDVSDYRPITDGHSFTATHSGTYTIKVRNVPDSTLGSGAEFYKLTMTIDYSNAQNDVYNGTYTTSDGHGGTATGNVDITYQDGSVLTGTDGDNTLLAGAGNDTLQGGLGHDVLVGGGGDDLLYGGDGDDLLIGGPGNDLLDGGAGIDTASYASATGGVTVNLNLATAQNTGGAGTDTLNGIENLIGSDYNDTLTGNGGDNLLIGGLGNDTLSGGAGNDVLLGGLGDDTLNGGTGNDTFVWQKGEVGHDTVLAFTPGSDHLDLSQLLQGENGTTASLDDYLHFKVTGSGVNVVSTIEVSSVAGAAPTQTIDLAGVDLAQHYGVTAGAGGVVAAGQDTATIINGMLNDHSLKVDTV
ncbi:TPA: beta strand repeat-containing protein, partial [Pseudomonas putida]